MSHTKRVAAEFLGTFWLAPIAGGALGGIAYHALVGPKPDIVGDAVEHAA